MYIHVTFLMLSPFLLGAISQVHAYFGEGSGAVHFDYVQCSGSEYGLTNCNTAKNVISTNHTEDVGVKCQPGMICSRYTVCWSQVILFYTLDTLCSVQLLDHSV